MRFKHSGGRGDIIYSLPAIRAMGGGILCLNITDDFHTSCPIYDYEVSFFAELLAEQSYIESVELWDGQRVDVDLDDFRLHLVRDRHLAESHLLAVGCEADLTQPWLDSSPFSPFDAVDVVISRTSRFHGLFNWSEIKSLDGNFLFVGNFEEYEQFMAHTDLRISYYDTPTFRSLAEIILGSRLFIGNQSFPFALAEAFKHPRLLEVFPDVPNCMPSGFGAYTKITPAFLE